MNIIIYNKEKTNQKGFTLIELIVVIVLIGLMFTFALPKMDGFLFTSSTDRVSRWIVLNVANLKKLSMKKQLVHVLNIDTESNSLWISTEDMDEAGVLEARENGFTFPESVNIVDVVYPFEGDEDGEFKDIFFYKQGYSDNAIIHIENNDDEKFSYIVQPFQQLVEISDGFVLFDD